MIPFPEAATVEEITDVLDVLKSQGKLAPIEDWVAWLDTNQNEAIKTLLS